MSVFNIFFNFYRQRRKILIGLRFDYLYYLYNLRLDLSLMCYNVFECSCVFTYYKLYRLYYIMVAYCVIQRII